MPKIEIEKTIHASQKQVWEFISDIKQAPEWVVVMNTLVETTDNPVRKDSVYRENSKIGPKESETEWRIIHFDEPHVQIHECNEPDFKAKLTMRVEDNRDGTSTLFHITEYQLMPKFRPLGWLLETLLVKKLMVRNLNETVENCKRMIEKNVQTEKYS